MPVVSSASTGAPAASSAAASLSVQPFENLSGDPAQDYFARGLVEDLLTELSRFPSLELVRTPAPTSLLDAPDAAGYVLRGSVRRAADEVRISVQLADARSGRQLWANRYEATADLLLDVQDEIVAQVAASLALRVDGDRLVHARRAPLGSLALYDLWLRGLDYLKRGTLEGDEQARRFFERALEIDPHYARAHAGLSLSHFNEWSCQAWELWDEKERLAFEHARRASELDDDDAMIHLILGRVHLFRREFAQGARHVDRALELNPSDPEVLVQAAGCRVYLGDHDGALALVRRAMRLNPLHPDYYVAVLALALTFVGQYAEAVEVGAQAPRGTVDAPAFLAAASALAGDARRASSYVAMYLADFEERITFGREPEPGEPLRWILHVNPFARPEDEALLTRGLRLAGLAADPDETRAPTAPPTEGAAPSARAAFRREGELWTIAFDGTVVRLSEAKGFLDLAQLLARPGQRAHCLELAGRPPDDGAGHPVLDERARNELRARARELQEEIDDADEAHDLGRAERARAELERLVEAASQAFGLRGRPRHLGSATERARSAVTWRIRSAIRKIGASHPPLGRHLGNSVRTGTYCEYAPERPVDWAL